ncbi:MAG TPA: hypothetical protein VMW20_04330 [Candidatus Nanoarchaeia archaeon]|nr:hypothetical protein [Candidatus Nanoarchaeia archaeon]
MFNKLLDFLNIDRWLGINTQIQSEKKPPYVVEEQVNLELAKYPGVLVRRIAEKLITDYTGSGLTLPTYTGMFEFIDGNGGRQVLLNIQAAIAAGGLVEQWITAGVYATWTAFPLITRTASSTCKQMYPVLYENELRSGASRDNANDRPFWLGYLAKTWRFNNTEFVATGRYLDDQVYSPTAILALETGATPIFLQATGYTSLTGKGLEKGDYYRVAVSPVYRGGQKGHPYKPLDRYSISTITTAPWTLQITMQWDKTGVDQTLLLPRVVAWDVFLAKVESTTEVATTYNFLERIDMNAPGNVFLELTGKFEDTAGTKTVAPTYIEFDDDFTDWETIFGGYIGFVCDIVGATNTYTYKVVASRGANGTKARYYFTGFVAADDADTCTVKIYSSWVDDTAGTGVYYYRLFLDNFYRKLGSEMYAYLGLPAGDTGISDFRYDYAAMAGHRLVIAGVEDHPGGNYSLPYTPDVIPALNFFRTPEEPIGMIPIGENVLIFTKRQPSHLSIFGNQNSRIINNFFAGTITSQKAVVAMDSDTIFGFDYEGPWMYNSRSGFDRIGDALKKWWDITLSETIKDTCQVYYMPLKEQVIFYFKDYTTAPYAQQGLGFAFDIRAFKEQNVYPWFMWVPNASSQPRAGCLSVNKHLVTGAAGYDGSRNLYDWDVAGSTSPTVASWVTLKIMKSQLAGQSRVHWDTMAVTYSGEDITVELSADGAAFTDVSSDLTANDKIFIRRFLNQFQLKITPDSGYAEFKLSTIQLTFKEREF